MLDSVVGCIQEGGVLFLAMSAMHLRALYVRQCCRVRSGAWDICLVSHSTVCWTVLKGVFRREGHCSWPCLASQSTGCWAVLYDVFRGFGSVSSFSEHCMLDSAAVCLQGVGSMSSFLEHCRHVGQCCSVCSGVGGVLFLAMCGISEHCMLDNVVGCVQGVRVYVRSI